MINAIDLSPGKTFVYQGALYTTISMLPNKTAMRKMICKTKVKNLRTGAITEFSFSGDDRIEDFHLDKRSMQYLYKDGTDFVFMDVESYDQITIPEERLEWEKNFLVENCMIDVTYYNDEIIGLLLPAKVDLLVTHSEHAVKGDTQTTARKDAEVETGYSLKVPLFVEEGDRITIKTDTGEYDKRA